MRNTHIHQYGDDILMPWRGQEVTGPVGTVKQYPPDVSQETRTHIESPVPWDDGPRATDGVAQSKGFLLHLSTIHLR